MGPESWMNLAGAVSANENASAEGEIRRSILGEESRKWITRLTFVV